MELNLNVLGFGKDAIKLDEKDAIKEHLKDNLKFINIELVHKGHYQPRYRDFLNNDSFVELVNSVKMSGLLQPILVREISDNQYEIIAGERRYQACKVLGLESIPCIIKDLTKLEAQVLAIVENIQREQLSPLEESEALSKLKEKYNLTVEEVANLIGKPRTTIANLIRVFVHASPRAKEKCKQGLIEFGHLRAILSLEHAVQEKVIELIIINKWSVRKTENYVRTNNHMNSLEKKKEIEYVSQFNFNKAKLCEHFETSVKVQEMANGKIRMQVEFTSLNEFKNYLNNIDDNNSKSNKTNEMDLVLEK